MKWDTAWHSLRNAANLPGLRFHDLRHTCITELAESGVPDMTIQAIAGHLSKRMLDHYSHIRIAAKRKALDDMERQREEKRHQPQPEASPRPSSSTENRYVTKHGTITVGPPWRSGLNC